MTKAEMAEVLRKGPARIVFVKKDGTSRSMLATLQQEALPPAKGGGRPTPPSILPVFDLEKSEWRSFLVDNVVSFKAL